MQKETHLRSIIKGLSWRVVASLTTMGLVYFYTRDLTLVAEVGALEVVLKILFYYLHERGWNAVSCGRA